MFGERTVKIKCSAVCTYFCSPQFRRKIFDVDSEPQFVVGGFPESTWSTVGACRAVCEKGKFSQSCPSRIYYANWFTPCLIRILWWYASRALSWTKGNHPSDTSMHFWLLGQELLSHCLTEAFCLFSQKTHRGSEDHLTQHHGRGKHL